MVARAVKSSIRVNGENGLVASDGTLHERYEYTPYGERTRKAGGLRSDHRPPITEARG